MQRIFRQAQLVQPFPYTHACIGRTVEGTLVEQRLLAQLFGFKAAALDLRAQVGGVIAAGGQHDHLESPVCAAALMLIVARIGQAERCWCASRRWPGQDRKSTRLNSSHVKISYAV